jgi:DNA-directed RNA polymerase subunit K/omega
MSDIKSKVQNIDPNVKSRNVKDFVKNNNNIYETLVAISDRASKVSVQVKQELHSKLEDFSVSSDTIEEILENKEQIEISKFYERLPNPATIATEEFLNGELSIDYVNFDEAQP